MVYEPIFSVFHCLNRFVIFTLRCPYDHFFCWNKENPPIAERILLWSVYNRCNHLECAKSSPRSVFGDEWKLHRCQLKQMYQPNLNGFSFYEACLTKNTKPASKPFTWKSCEKSCESSTRKTRSSRFLSQLPSLAVSAVSGQLVRRLKNTNN